MSVSYSASTIIGVAVPIDKMEQNILERIGNHEYDESVKFNPETGAPLWRTYSRPLINTDEHDDIESAISHKELSDRGLGIFKPNPVYGEAKHYFIGIVMTQGENDDDVPLLPIAEFNPFMLAEAIQGVSAMLKLDLTIEDLGIYTLLSAS